MYSRFLKDLELKAVGLDPETNKMQEGYFSAFRSIGLPIHGEDNANPYSPVGGNIEKALPKADPVDPKDTAPATASGTLDPNKLFAAKIAKSQENFLNTFMLVSNCVD